MAIDLDGLEIKTVIHHLDQHKDGSYFVKKTDVEIEQEASLTIDGKKYAQTTVIYELNGEYYDGGVLLEPIVEGGLRPSAAYDYSNWNSVEGNQQKFSEDWEYIGWKLWRIEEVYDRDNNAPDNLINIQDLEVLDVLNRGKKINSESITLGSKKGTHRQKPDPNATGDHTVLKEKNGQIEGYTTYKPNSKNPSGFDEVKRVDKKGKAHYDKTSQQYIPTPHVHEGKDTRPAKVDEIPRR